LVLVLSQEINRKQARTVNACQKCHFENVEQKKQWKNMEISSKAAQTALLDTM